MTKSELLPIEIWMTDEELLTEYSSSYWNDIEEEKKKDWWIADGDYNKCLLYLENSGLFSEYKIAEQWIKEIDRTNLQVADLAAGIGWTSALLTRNENVGMVHIVDISKHRLELVENAIDMLDGEPSKIKRYQGSFYNLRFDDQSMDVIFLSQAFHHAHNPLKLMSEMNRILCSGGQLL